MSSWLARDHPLAQARRRAGDPPREAKRNRWPNFVVRVVLSVGAFARLTTRESVHTILGARGLDPAGWEAAGEAS